MVKDRRVTEFWLLQEDYLEAMGCPAQASLVGKALEQASLVGKDLQQASLVGKDLAMVSSAMVSSAMASSAMASSAITAFLERQVCLAQGCLEKEVS